MRAIWILSLALPLSAQWLTYPTPGIPRLANGKPNLNAPAPRMSNGKPDFSGVWDVEHNRPCPATGCDMLIPWEFLNIGWSLKDGLPFQPWARDITARRTAESGKDDPGSHCLPTGIIHAHTTPLFKKYVQSPGLLVILSERTVTFRQIFTDGRPLPADPNPTFDGYSVGKWEGDTLVVQSNGFSDGIWLDRNGSPVTDAAKITERFRRPTLGKLEIEITVDDPKAYTRPWTVKLNQILAPDTDLLPYVCLENEKDAQHLQ